MPALGLPRRGHEQRPGVGREASAAVAGLDGLPLLLRAVRAITRVSRVVERTYGAAISIEDAPGVAFAVGRH